MTQEPVDWERKKSTKKQISVTREINKQAGLQKTTEEHDSRVLQESMWVKTERRKQKTQVKQTENWN